MFYEELMLLVVGMGIVFIFLALLVVATQWTTSIIVKASDKRQEESSTHG